MTRKFDPTEFLPYLLNQAAEQTSVAFQKVYKSRYGMLRTEWRVMFHLGHFGTMTARQICDRAGLHKTKVSRAVHALGDRRFLVRRPHDEDRRHEDLTLTRAGRTAYEDLLDVAEALQRSLVADMRDADYAVLRDTLRRLAKL